MTPEPQGCPLENPLHYYQNGHWTGCHCLAGQIEITEDTEET